MGKLEWLQDHLRSLMLIIPCGVFFLVVLAGRSKIGPCLTTFKKLWFESVDEDYTIQLFSSLDTRTVRFKMILLLCS